MDQDFFTGSLQESLLTLLAFDDYYGNQVIGQLDLKFFDRPYRDLAEKIIDWRNHYHKPPGVEHLDDLFDAMLETGDKDNRKLIQTMLEAMVRQSRGLNAEYIANKTSAFIRRQVLKDGLVRASERLGQGGPGTDDAVESIMETALKHRHKLVQSGISLANIDSSLNFLDYPVEPFLWGIKELDKRFLGPVRKELMLYIAPRKKGKTWAMVHLGKVNLIGGEKVLHISLEMSEQKIAQRYLQSLFGVASFPDRSLVTRLELDEFGHISELRKDHRLPRMNFQDPNIRSKLAAKITQAGMRFGNLRIKDFPSGTLTISQLNAYLDHLESTDNFIPDLLIVDYPDLMEIGDPKFLRQTLGKLFVDLRGIAVERNLALVAPTQSGRKATNASEVSETDVAEDISKVATADVIFTYSQTKEEKKIKTARLTAVNARNAEDGLAVLITQDYSTGQFCFESALVTSKYFQALKRAMGDMTDGDDED